MQHVVQRRSSKLTVSFCPELSGVRDLYMATDRVIALWSLSDVIVQCKPEIQGVGSNPNRNAIFPSFVTPTALRP